MKSPFKHLIFVVLIIQSGTLFGQTEEERHDSLLSIIEREKEDTLTVLAYFDLAYPIHTSEPVQAHDYLIKGLRISQDIGYTLGEARVLGLLAAVNYSLGKYHDAMDYYFRSLETFRALTQGEGAWEINEGYAGMSASYQSIARCFCQMNDLKNFEKYANLARANMRAHPLRYNMDGWTNIELAGCFFQHDKPERAMEYFQEARATFERTNNLFGMGNINGNIGLMYYRSGNLDSSLHYLNNSFAIYKSLESPDGICWVANLLGNTHLKMNALDSARHYYFLALEKGREMHLQSGAISTLMNLANMDLLEDNYAPAVEKLEEALDIANEGAQYGRVVELTAELTEVTENAGKYEDALDYFRMHITALDCVSVQKEQKAIGRMEAQFEYDKLTTIQETKHEEALRTERAIAEAEQDRQRLVINAVSIGSGVLLLLLLFIFNRFRITRKQKKVIELQKELVEEKNQEILDSINYAKRIQAAILPPASRLNSVLPEHFILYQPKDIVAGDFYWLEERDGKKLLAAADCTGHGVPGAMVSVVCVNGLNRSVREHGITKPGEILNKTREIVLSEFEKSEEEVRDGMDISLIAFRQEGKKVLVDFAGANNTLWIIRAGQQKIEELRGDKQPIGKYTNQQPFNTHQTVLEKGDSMYLFTDGLVDQFGGPKGKKFKRKQLQELLISNVSLPLQEQKELIASSFTNWKGSLEQVDDVCIIGVRV